MEEKGGRKKTKAPSLDSFSGGKQLKKKKRLLALSGYAMFACARFCAS